MRLLAVVFGLFCVTATAPLAAAQTFDARTFFGEDRIDDFWLYRFNGVQDVEVRIVGTQQIGGTLTTVSRWSGGPLDATEDNTSFDASSGSLLWRSFRPDFFVDGVGFVDQLIVYSPPLVSSLPSITVGEVVTSQGTFTQTFFTDFGTFAQPGTVQSRYRYAQIDAVSVPFGDFNALQRQIQLDLRLEVEPGVFEDIRVTSRDWVVPGIGSIRIEQNFPDHIDRYELVDTNRQLLPEGTTQSSQFVALMVLVGLYAARGQRRPQGCTQEATFR